MLARYCTADGTHLRTKPILAAYIPQTSLRRLQLHGLATGGKKADIVARVTEHVQQQGQ